MNDREENRLSGYRSISVFFGDNASAFTSVPVLGVQAGKLTDSVALIDALAALQGTNNTGITQAKAELLRQMIATTYVVAGAIGAYASEAGDLALKARVKVNPTKFHDARDDQKDDVAQVIHDAGNDTLANLTDYPVTAATLSAFQTRIDAYRLSIPTPRNAIKGRKTNGELIGQELDRAGMICDERLDGLMESFKETQPTLYSQYHGLRKTIDTGHRKKKPSGGGGDITPPSGGTPTAPTS
jgi:hypothetical protein